MRAGIILKSLALLGIVGAASSLRAQECGSGAGFSGPITITKGGTYTGNWQSQDPSMPAVKISTTQSVTIVSSRVRGPGDLVLAGSRSNLTIRESCFVGTNPNVAGKSKGSAIHAFEAVSVVVEHCDFESVGYYGIWVQRYLGDFSSNNSVTIRYNRFHNVDGRFSNGNGGYSTQTGEKAHAIILSNVYGVPGIEIAWNQIINEPYQSRVEDSIDIFDSSGTRASPMQVHDNYIQGGWDSDPTNDDASAYTGSAFTTDGLFQTDPNLTTSFVKVHDNQAVGFGHVGLGIGIGHDIEMYSNRVISSGQLANGANYTTSYGTGIVHSNNFRNNPSGVFGNNSVHDNVSGRRRLRKGNWERFDYYFGTPAAVNTNNTQWTPTTVSAPTSTDEANEIVLWDQKLVSQHITVGSHLVVQPPNGSPFAPIGLTASSSGSSVTLSWNAPLTGPAPTRYVIEAGSSPGLADLANFSTGSTATTFSATRVAAGTYYVRVRAANLIGSSAPSNEISLTVGSGSCVAAPSPPAGLNASVVGSTVTLQWNESVGSPTSYIVEAGSLAGLSNLASFDTGSMMPKLTASGVAAGTYFVRVKGKNDCGISTPSNEVVIVVR